MAYCKKNFKNILTFFSSYAIIFTGDLIHSGFLPSPFFSLQLIDHQLQASFFCKKSFKMWDNVPLTTPNSIGSIMQSMYFDKAVQEQIKKSLVMIKGNENKEDATQEAYLAIKDESPLTIEDACACVRRAIERFRWQIRKIANRDAEGSGSTHCRIPPEWEDFAYRYLGIIEDDDSDGIADTRDYSTADFVVRKRAFY